MSTATKSRILLSTFIVLLGAIGIYFILYGGNYTWFGWVLTLLTLVALVWTWLPAFKKKS
jgi:hypothetical protein